MKKTIFYTELAYIFGLLILAVSAALTERADFGVSMVIAPAYLLHLKVSQFLPFFTFGMAEYTFQALLLVVTMLVLRKAKLSYFFSLVTAVLYGFALDGAMAIIALIPETSFAADLIMYIIGILLGTAAISLLFHTYISPEAYELFVKEVSRKFGYDLHRFKIVYDCSSCVISILMSFLFFGLWHFEGIKLGSVLSALVNGPLIALFSKLFERFFRFEDRLPLKKYF
ncbi:MAG: hypothetical protein IJY88_04280 [Clostridia bacterium]|nr:hypothetical protein [Clostridia bacterium]